MSGSPARSPASDAPTRAGLLRRYMALVYETLLLMALVLIAGFALTPLVSPGPANPAGPTLPSIAGRAISCIALILLGAWFYGWCWSRGRRTLPMKTWRIALVSSDGASPSRRQALVRYAAVWIGPLLALAVYLALEPRQLGALAWPVLALNWLSAFVDPDRQFLHDRLAGTRLVMASGESPRAAATVPPPPR